MANYITHFKVMSKKYLGIEEEPKNVRQKNGGKERQWKRYISQTLFAAGINIWEIDLRRALAG